MIKDLKRFNSEENVKEAGLQAFFVGIRIVVFFGLFLLSFLIMIIVAQISFEAFCQVIKIFSIMVVILFLAFKFFWTMLRWTDRFPKTFFAVISLSWAVLIWNLYLIDTQARDNVAKTKIEQKMKLQKEHQEQEEKSPEVIAKAEKA